MHGWLSDELFASLNNLITQYQLHLVTTVNQSGWWMLRRYSISTISKWNGWRFSSRSAAWIVEGMIKLSQCCVIKFFRLAHISFDNPIVNMLYAIRAPLPSTFLCVYKERRQWLLKAAAFGRDDFCYASAFSFPVCGGFGVILPRMVNTNRAFRSDPERWFVPFPGQSMQNHITRYFPWYGRDCWSQE